MLSSGLFRGIAEVVYEGFLALNPKPSNQQFQKLLSKRQHSTPGQAGARQNVASLDSLFVVTRACSVDRNKTSDRSGVFKQKAWM